jgi:hypothetical protein
MLEQGDEMQMDLEPTSQFNHCGAPKYRTISVTGWQEPFPIFHRSYSRFSLNLDSSIQLDLGWNETTVRKHETIVEEVGVDMICSSGLLTIDEDSIGN